MDSANLTRVVTDCLRQVLEEAKALPDEPLTRETRLLGRNAVLDSLGLVHLLLEIEQRLAESHHVEVTLADERAMSQSQSPFRTVGTVVDYLDSLIRESGGHGGT